MIIKKIILITICLHASCTSTNLQANFSLFSKTESSIDQLSINQIFQLNYLKEELKHYATLVSDDWTDDENVRILLERTELAVQQASSSAQEIIKQRVIDIFKEFHINVQFTSENMIELADEQDDHPIDDTTKSHSKEKNIKASSTSTSHTKILPRIKGANSTRKKLEKAWEDRKRAAELAQKQAEARAHSEESNIHTHTHAPHTSTNHQNQDSPQKKADDFRRQQQAKQFIEEENEQPIIHEGFQGHDEAEILP